MTHRTRQLILDTSLVLVGAGVVFFLAMMSMIEPNVAYVPFLIVCGWFNFLGRVVPQIDWSWPGLASAVLCVVVVGVAFHWLGRWLAKWPAEVKLAWRWTKAPVLVIGVAALFWAGMSGVGVLRSVQWFAQTEERLIGQPLSLR